MKRGQAMIELAVFGSLTMFTMAFMIRYGLQYNYSQVTQQETFRLALARAHEAYPLQQASVFLIRDRRMVDPTSPFVNSERQTFLGVSSVSLSNKGAVLGVETDSEIPVQHVIFNDRDQPLKLRLADFRDEPNILRSRICAYVSVLGRAAVQIIDPRDGVTSLRYQCPTRFNNPKINNDPGNATLYFTLRILDQCVGDIMEPTSCKLTCDALKNAFLRQPAYCTNGSIPPSSTQMGVDLDHLTHQRVTIRNQRARMETPTRQTSQTSIHDQDSYERQIKLSPMAVRRSPYDPNGDHRAETKQTVDSTQTESFSTPW